MSACLRTYTAQINDIALLITMRTQYGIRWAEGTLTWPDQRMVLFSPEDVSDRLGPRVKKLAGEALEMDREFMRGALAPQP